jgi:hypothetical protein
MILWKLILDHYCLDYIWNSQLIKVGQFGIGMGTVTVTLVETNVFCLNLQVSSTPYQLANVLKYLPYVP